MDTVAARFGRKQYIQARTVPIYPKSAEREMQRLVNSYMNAVIKAVKTEAFTRMDARDDIDKLATSEATEARLKKIAKQVETQTFREWNRSVKDALGIDLDIGYYVGGLYESSVVQWLLSVTKQLSELPSAARRAVRAEIDRAKMKGLGIKELQKAVNQKLNSLKRQAKVRGAATVAFLFGLLNKITQRDSGCGKYVWRTARDDRVRPCHKALDGHIFAWDNPPEMWKETSRGRVYTGRRCHPGEDWGCRCVAVPVFERERLKLPVRGV